MQDKEYLDRFGDKLSNSTKYSKWISKIDEHEDHEGQSLATRNHEVITSWAEERNAIPATISGTEHNDHLGVLRFNFPGFDEFNDLMQVSWEDWFKSFDERDLVFLYQEHLKNGNLSNFFKFDSPHREEG